MRIAKLILFVTLLLPACGDEVARVGPATICARDLARRVRVTEIHSPGSGTNQAALSQLIKGNLSLEILRSHGRTVDDSVLKKEAKRIDESSQAPEALEKIKALYGSDHTSYLRTYVALAYAERVLYTEVFLKSPDAQTAGCGKAESLLRKTASDPSSFSAAAKKLGVPVTRLRVSLKYGVMPLSFVPLSTPPPHATGLAHADRLQHLLADTKPGTVHDRVIEWQENFQVVRFLDKEGQDLIIESVIIPKRSYDDWFWEQASKVPVRIKNVALRAELLREIPWASRLKLD